jgi:predicted O-methyltransferase YrrM
MTSEERWHPTQTDLDWIESIGSPIHPILAEIEVAARPDSIPILARASGRVLAALAANRRGIVEVGTAYGYSTLWMALAQRSDGTIVTIDPDRGRTEIARGFWRRAGVADERIDVVNEPALDAFGSGDPRLTGAFDLAFIDAVKNEYVSYFEAIVPRLAPGATVVADNVLWKGRASGARPAGAGDSSTEALRAFSMAVLRDPRFTGTILPVGDGLLVATLR